MKRKLSLYVHIPFCQKKCHYCDFLSFDSQLSKLPSYMEGLIAEIEHYGRRYGDRSVTTIFFGGGTPSILDGMQLKRLMETIRTAFDIETGVEITMECNPGTLSRDKIQAYKEAGINRISMGLQASQDDKLQRLGRIHTYGQFVENFHNLREAGFDNINIDLMMGLPEQSMAEWQDTLERVMDLKPEHISAYGLIIEENTPFGDDYEMGRLFVPDEDTERQMYDLTRSRLAELGYERYEISNYARRGFECRHNNVYWLGGDYLGIGLGASGFIDGVRVTNTDDLDRYVALKGNPDQIIAERAIIDQKTAMEEYCFLGLRLMKGISPNAFSEKFGVEFDDVYGFISKKLISEGLLTSVGKDNLRLTDKGVDISNYVLAHFIQ